MIPPLYAIVDVEVCRRAGRSPLEVFRACVQGGARWLQLRAKTLGSGAFLELASAMVEGAAGATVIVNDRADVAVLAGAPGVHVGQDDLTPADARRVMGSRAIVGLSTHSAAQVAAAVQAPISYLAVGPVFETATKETGYAAVGLGAVRAAAAAASATALPVVAIGGITLATAPAVLGAGASAVAIIGDLLAEDPEARVRRYLSALA